MDIIIKETEQIIADYMSDRILEHLKQDHLITLASGDTVLETYRLLVKKYQAAPFPIKATIVNLDEWVGLDRNDRGGCQYHMYNDLYDYLNIPEDQLYVFDAKAQDLNQACKAMDDRIGDRTFDFVLLGIGMNGHLALNEPGCSFENKAFHTELSDTTKVVMKKYFDEEKTITQGISLGIRYFVESKELVLMATGTRKHDICNEIIRSEVTNQLPATSAKLSKHAELFMDLDCYLGNE